MKRSQQELEAQYKERKRAQLLLSSSVFPQFIQTYRSETSSLEFLTQTSETPKKGTWLIPNFRKKQPASDSSEVSTARSLVTESQKHLKALDAFAPNGLVAEVNLRRLASTKDDLARALFPHGTGYADNKHYGYGLLGFAMIGASKFMLNIVGFKLGLALFLAGTALCSVSAWHICRGSKPTNDLDGQVVQEATEIDQEVGENLVSINEQHANAGSALMQETSLATVIHNVQLCQDVYNQRYLPAMQLATGQQNRMLFG